MGLSRSAKRGIAVMSHLQWKTKNWKYHVPAPTMIDLNNQKFDASIVQAGVDAIAKMRENANAIQKLSESKDNSESTGAEGRTERDIPVQPEDGPQGPEGTTPGETGGGLK